ncbi:MAG TPA: LytR C-terminal domain-containing protein [Actinomycetota bacterium]|nr:LytR C-terminal domain-containing protein [Actinomycetota bacterium]
MIVVVAGPEAQEDELRALSLQLSDARYSVDIVLCADCPLREHTVIQYAADARVEAKRITREFLPGIVAESVAWPDTKPDIQITLGADYRKLANGAVRVRVLDAGGGTGDTEHAATVLEEAGYDVVEVGKAPALYDNTIVACAPSHDEEGFRILKRFLPDAHFTGEVPAEDHDVTVYIGPDYRQGGAAGN